MTARPASARAFLAVFLLALGLPAAAWPQSAGTTVGGATARAVADRDQVAVVEVTGNYDQKLPDGATNADPRAAVAREFFKSHPDEYDFLIAWSTFEFNTAEARAFYLGIRNDVQGIGLEAFDNSDYFGSNHKLQGYVDMAALSRGTTDPLNPGFENNLLVLGHEMLHRWAAHIHFKLPDGSLSSALLGRDGVHWSFLLDTDASVLYGADWRDNGDGTFTAGSVLKFWSPLDLYLAGFYTPQQVPPFFYIDSPSTDPTQLSRSGATVSGTKRTVTVDDVIAAEGPRIPAAADSQKRFRAAILLVTRPGEAVTDAQIAGLNRMRREIETRFSALTGGQGLLEVEPQAIAGTPGSPTPLPGGGTLRPSASLVDGVSWLRGRQAADGSWQDTPATQVRDTIVALTTLVSIDTGFPPANLDRALTFLRAHPGANTDFMARLGNVLQKVGGDGAAARASLLALQNADGGWGAGPGYGSDAMDTALAILALTAAPAPSATESAAASRAAGFLTAGQNADGGWSGVQGGPSRTSVTATVLRALRAAGADAAAGPRALAWLANRQNRTDGGFGDSPSTVHDTANALDALISVQSLAQINATAASGYLGSRQTTEGSWDGSVYATAVALSALKRFGFPNWTFTGAPAVSPQSPRDGERVKLTFQVVNDGNIAAPASLLRLYDGDPAQGSLPAAADAVLPPMGPGAIVTVTFYWDSKDKPGPHMLYAVIDPDGAVPELAEGDNRVSVAVAVQPAPALADLEVQAPDLAVSPPQPSSLPVDLAISVAVRNLGHADAGAVAVELRTGPAQGGTVEERKTVAIPGRSGAVVNFVYRLSTPGTTTLRVVVDPDNTVPEDREDNNTASRDVSTGPSLDLAVADADLSISGTAFTGNDVTFKAVVHNLGTVDSPPAVVRFVVTDGTIRREIGRSTVLLAAGQSAERTVPWRVDLEGALHLEVAIDPDSLVPEADEANNTASLAFTSGAVDVPNLTLSHTDLGFDPNPGREGKPLTLTANVRNNGGQPAADVEVAFYEGDPAQGAPRIGEVVTIPSIAAGGSAVATLVWPRVPDAGDRVIHVVVDPAGKIPEFSEDDNSAFEVLRINSLPDAALSAASLDLAPRFPAPGEPVTLTVTVSNLGEQDVQGLIVRAWDGDPAAGGTPVAADQVVNLPGSSGAQAVFHWTYASGGGSRPLVVTADPDNAVEEGSETNNTARLDVAIQQGDLFVTQRYFSPNGDGVQDTTQLFFRLASPAQSLQVVDSVRNRVVRQQALGGVAAGQFEWDGRDDLGRLVRDADYSFRLLDAAGATLGETVATLDNDRSSLLLAAGTPFGVTNNLTCELPEISQPILTDHEDLYYFYVPERLFDGPPDPIYRRGLYRMSAEGGDVQPLVTADWFGNRVPADLQVAPDGSKLAFVANPNNFSNGAAELWAANPDGSGLVKVAQDITLLGLSVDGHTIYGTDANSAIVALAPTASATPRVILPDTRVESWAFSPDRRHLAFTTGGTGSGTPTLLLDLETGASTVVASQPGPLFHHLTPRAWSADSRYLAIPDTESGSLRIFDAAGHLVREISPPPFDGSSSGPVQAISMDPVWASSGSELAYQVFYGSAFCQGDAGGSIVRVDLEGGEPEKVAALAGRRGCGELVARASSVAGASELSTPQSDDDPADETLPFDGSLLWDPGDRSLLIVSHRSGLHATAIFLDEDNRQAPFFDTFDQLEEVRFSSTGRKLLFLSSDARNNPQSPCYHRGTFDSWSFQSLLNLTADLRIRRSAGGSGGFLLEGTAADLHFSRYLLEYATASAPNVWRPVAPPGGHPVIDGRFTTWVAPGPDAYLVRLTVEDLAGNRLSRIKRVSSVDTPSLTDLYASPDYVSPNGDGVQDAWTVHYRVLTPVHLEFRIFDESGARVRTLERDHSVPGSELDLTWDGRDDRGLAVPDGLYRLTVQGYEFFVVVDTTPPAVTIAASQLGSCGAPNAGVSFRVEELNFDLADRSLVVPEHGEGLAPSLWLPDDYGLKRIQGGRIPGTLYGGNFGGIDLSRIATQLFRVEARDLAGNRTRVMTGPAAEVVSVTGFGRHEIDPATGQLRTLTPVGCGTHVNLDLGLARFSTIETVRTPLTALFVQFQPAPIVFGETRLDFVRPELWDQTPVTVFVPPLAGGALPDLNLQFLWTMEQIQPNVIMAVRVRAIDERGGEHFSGVFSVGQIQTEGIQFRGILTRSSQAESLAPTVEAMLAEAGLDPAVDKVLWGTETVKPPLAGVTLLLSSTDDPRYATPRSLAPVAIRDGIFLFRMVDWQSCLRYTGRLQAVTEPFPDPDTGKVATKRFESQGGFKIDCLGLTVVRKPLSLGECGGPGTGAVQSFTFTPRSLDGTELGTLTFSGPGRDGRQTLLFNVNRPQSGRDYTFNLDTGDIPEGRYDLVAQLTNVNDQVVVEKPFFGGLDENLTLIVDRTPPVLSFSYPQDGQRICGVRRGADSVVDIQGLVQDAGGDAYALTVSGPGIPAGGDSAGGTLGWNAEHEVFDRFSGPPQQLFKVLRQPRAVGTLGTFANRSGDFTAHLEVIDNGGFRRCVDRSFYFDGVVEGHGASIDRELISPNGDGVLDDATVTFRAAEPVNADVKVYPSKFIYTIFGRTCVRTGLAVRTVGSQIPILDVGTATWNGRDDGGNRVADGVYQVDVAFRDACGNQAAFTGLCLEVDDTPPALTIAYPHAGDPLALVVEARGSVADPHLQGWSLDFGQGTDPETWARIHGGTQEVDNDFLGAWNTFGLEGDQTLRILAVDKAGNQGELHVPIVLPTRTGLIAYLEGAPRIFSPNGDGKLETASLRFGLVNDARADLTILDGGGAPVARLLTDQALPSGSQVRSWDGTVTGGAPAPDGTYRAELAARLQSNLNVTQRESVTVDLDRTPPSIQISRPTAAGFVTPTGAVTGTVQDAHLAEYVVSLTGTPQAPAWQELTRGTVNRLDFPFASLEGLDEGDYALRVQASDAGQILSEQVIPFTVDSTPPVVHLTAPVAGSVVGAVGGPLAIAGTIVEIHLASWRLEAGRGAEPTSWTALASGDTLPLPLAATWNLLGVADGPWTVRLVAVDRAGQTAETRVALIVDNTPPTAVITQPAEGGYVTGPRGIEGTATDANLAEYRLAVAAGTGIQFSDLGAGSAPVTAGHLLDWLTLPPDGPQTLRLTVTDRAGNQATATVRVTVDTRPPGAPQDLVATLEQGRDARLTWRPNTEPDLAGYVIDRDGVRITPQPIPAITLATYLDVALADGLHAYTVRAVDRAGQESPPSVAAQVKVDHSAPVALIFQPAAGSRVGGVVDVKGTAFSADDFKEFRLFAIAGTGGSTQLLRRSPVPVQAGLLAQWSTLGLPEDAAYTLRLEAEDVAGNVATVTAAVTVDNRPPAAPTGLAGTVSAATVNLTWHANTEPDLAGYLLYRDGHLVNALGPVVGDLTPYLLTSTAYADAQLPDGTFTYQVYAVDKAGNLSDPSAAVQVTVDNRAPHAVITLPADGSSFDGSVYVLATTPDTDVARVQFQFKSTASSVWTDLGSADTAAPWETDWAPGALARGAYELRAVATDRGNRTDPAPTAITVTYADLTPPPAPLGLSVHVDGGDVTLSWTAVSDPGLAGYHVERANADGSVERLTPAPVTAVTFLDPGVADGVYGYHVLSVDAAGNESAASADVPATVSTPRLVQPYTPTAGTSTTLEGATLPNLQVTGSATGPGGTSPLPPLTADAQGLFAEPDLPLARGETNLAVRGTDAAGNRTKEAAVPVVSDAAPAPPTGLVAAAPAGTLGVELSWNANSESDLLGYRLLRDDQPVPAPQAIADFTGATDTDGAGPEVVIDGDLNSVWFPYSTPGPDGPWLQVTWPERRLIARVEIDWGTDANTEGILAALNAVNYDVEAWDGRVWVAVARVRGDAGAASRIVLAQPYRTDRLRLLFLASSAPPEIAELRVYHHPLVTGTTATDTATDGAHAWRLIAVDQLGLESAPSDAAGLTVAPPDAVTLTASVTGAGADVLLTWTASSSAVRYDVFRDGAKVAETADLTYTDAARPNGLYHYTVRAVDGVGNSSAPSNEAAVTIAVPVPAAPVSLTLAVLPEGGALSLAWTPGAGPAPAAYRLLRGTAVGGPYLPVMVTGGTTFVDRGLTNGQLYAYVVVALDGLGNASAVSNEASGTPADTVAPAAPVLHFPGFAGLPATTQADHTPVMGTAEPGAAVTLFRNGTPVGQVTAQAQDVRSDATSGVFGLALLSPDGRYLLSGSFGFGALYDFKTGLSTEVPSLQESPAWLPDASGLTFLSNGVVHLYRLADAADSILLTPGDSDFIAAAMPAPDARTLAVFGSHDGVYSLWRVDTTAGTAGTWSLLSAESEVDSRSLAASPDGSAFAFRRSAFNDQSLVVVRSSGGGNPAVTVVEPNPGPSPLHWSPGGDTLLYTAFVNGVEEVHSFRLADGTAAVLAAGPEDRSEPVWSPDGRSLYYAIQRVGVFRRDLAAGEPVQVLDAAGSGSFIQLDTAAAGYVVAVVNNVPVRIAPAGRFELGSVGLNAGESAFTALAADAAGNQSPASAPMIVNRIAGARPNLAIAVSDLALLPAAPLAGSVARVTVTVHNLGTVHSPAADLSIAVVGPNGFNADLSAGPALGPLAPGGTQTLTRDVALGAAGRYTLAAAADPLDHMAETDETDNRAQKEWTVAAAGVPTVTVATDRAVVPAGGVLGIAADLVNYGDPLSGRLTVTVEDAGGVALATLLDQPVTGLAYAATLHRDLTWNPGTAFAGSYQVSARLFDPAGVLRAEAHAPFAVGAFVQVTAGVETDRGSYAAGSTVRITGTVDYRDGNQPLTGGVARILVFGAGAAPLAEIVRPLGDLLPGSQGTVTADWPSGTSVAGSYRARLVVEQGGAALTSAETRFDLTTGAVTAEGTLALSNRSPAWGSALDATLTVRNRGTAALTQLPVRVRVQDPAAGTVLATVALVVDLPAGGSASRTVPLDTRAIGLGNRLVVLEADLPATGTPGGTHTVTLDAASLTVVDATPPVVSIVAPAAGAQTGPAVTVTVSARDALSPVRKVEASLDGGPWQTLDLRDAGAGLYGRNLSGLAVGNHVLSARATDSWGNVGVAGPVTFTVTPVVTGTPHLTATKVATLATDADGDARPSPGDVLEYQVTIVNTGNAAATGVVFVDPVPAYSTLVPGSVTASAGSLTNESPVRVTVGTLAPAGRVDVRFRVSLDAVVPAGVSSVSNQGAVTSDQLPGVLTDDPAVGGAADPTVTAITAEPRLVAELTDSLAVDADGNGSPSPGDTIEYRAVVRNAGNRATADVVLTAPIPSYTSAVAGSAATTDGTVASFDAAGLRVEIPELAGGRSATVTFRVRIDGTVPAGVRQISLQGQVASAELPAVPTDDPRAGGNADPTVTPITAAPSLTATKTATLFADADHDGAASPGDTLLYRIEVVNGGNTAATGVTVNDSIPAGAELEAASVQVSQGSVASESPVAAELGDLAAGASGVVTFRVRVVSPFPHSLTAVANQASVASAELPLVATDDPATPAAGDATVTPIIASPLLAATKTAALAADGDKDGDGHPSPGDVLEYHVTIANTGNTSATGVAFADSAPVHTTVVPGSVTSSAGSVDDESPLRVTVGELGAGGRVDVRFQVAIDPVLPVGITSIANQGAMASDQLPGVLTDDPAVGGTADPTVTALTAAPRLAAELTDTLAVDADGNGSPSPGDTLEYRAVVRNTGNTSATQVDLTAPLPAHTTAVAGSAVAAPGTVTAFDAGGLRASLGELAGGQSATVTFRVKVDATVPAGVRAIALQGQVASAELAVVLTDDPGVGGTADPTVTQIAASPVLTATKTATLYADADNNGVASPGDTLLYRIQVVNGGNTAATAVTVIDPIPSGVTLEAGSVQSGQGSVTSEAPPRVDLGEIAAGASAVVTFRARVDSPFPTSLTAVSNQATVASAELPAVASDDPATPAVGDATVTPITAAPRLAASLTASLAVDADGNGLPSPGDTLEYRTVVSNSGNRSATSVVLTSPIPARTSAVAGSAVTTAGSVTSFGAGGLSVSVGTLPVGSTVTVTFRVRVDPTVPAGVHAVSLQGTMASAELRPVTTDDPGAPGVADPTVTPLTTAPALAARKTAVLFTDADADGAVSPGDTLLYRIEVANAGNTSATAVVVSDAVPAGLTLDAGSVQVTQGAVTSEAPVRAELGEIVAGSSAAVTFRAHVVSPFPSSQTAVSNQGSVASNELAVLATDDPATLALSDPTVTPVVVTPRVSIDSAAGTEGQSPMTFTVRLSTAANHEVRVSWATVDGTALAGTDFVAASGTLVFAAGETSKTLQVVLVNDAVTETDEAFTVRLSAPIGAVLAIAEAAGTIHDDDTAQASRLAIADTSVAEGSSGTASAVFTVTLTPVASQEVRVAWATANGTATAGADYTAASGTLVFAAGQTTKTIAVSVLGDQLLEPDETFLVNLTSPVGATISRAQATGTIRDDEQCAGPNLLVNPGAESPSPFLVGALVFPGWNVAFGSLPWQQRTADPAPLEGGAYFAPGVSPLFAELYQDVPVAAWAQPIDAGGQSFGFAGWVRTRAETPSDTARIVVEYRNAANTVVLDAFDSGDLTSTTAWRQVTSTRPAPAGTRFVRVRLLATRFAGLAADGYFDSLSLTSLRAPVLTAGDTTVYEAASGTTNANFTVTLSCPYYHDVTVHYATADGTAHAGSDYQPVSGTLSFPAGTVSRSVAVPVVGDTVDEPHETFYVDLSQATPAAEAVLGDARGQGLIVNDDACAKGPGYWKTHPLVWPASSLVLGGRRYIATDLLAILSYSGPDGATHLARQLIATKLNLLVGSAPSILPSVDDADAFLALFPPGSNPKGSSKTQANTIKDRLEHYNEDNECDDD